MKWAGVKTIVVSPDDPEANGLAENFMKPLSKVWHTAHIEGKNAKQETYKFLRHYRATPHTTTGKAPAELLFNRKFTVRLPELQVPVHDPQLRQRNAKAKAKQKAYKDSQANVKHHSIQVNDKVLLLQRQSKTKSRYDPVPYKVIKVQGTQITATRGNQVRQRDAKKFKKVYTFPPTNYRRGRCPIVAHRDTPITFDSDQPANNLTGTDTTTGPTPEPTRTTPAPRPQAQQPPDLNRHPIHTWIHTLTVRSPESKEAVDPQSNTTLRQALGHKELYENGLQLEDLLKFNSAPCVICQNRGGRNIRLVKDQTLQLVCVYVSCREREGCNV